MSGNKHGDRRTMLLVPSILLTIIAIVFVLARLYTRIFMTKAYAWDDGLMTVTLLLAIVTMALTFASISTGYGQQIETLSLNDAITTLKFSQIGIITNAMTMILLKVSIGLSLLRIKLGMRLAVLIWFAMVIGFLTNGATIVSVLISCSPIAKEWNSSLPGKCLPRLLNEVTAYIQGAGNILTDLVFTFGPLIYIAKVKLSKYNKWALQCVFMIGLLATICGIVKVTELPVLLKTDDPTYDGAALTTWVDAEMNIGLFAASLPPLKSTFERILRYFNIRSEYSSNAYTGYYAGDRLPEGTNSTITARDTRRQTQSSKGMGRMRSEYGDPPFVLEPMGRRNQSALDDVSTDDDERRIVEHGAPTGQSEGGPWITKTVEYTVSHDRQS